MNYKLAYALDFHPWENAEKHPDADIYLYRIKT